MLSQPSTACTATLRRRTDAQPEPWPPLGVDLGEDTLSQVGLCPSYPDESLRRFTAQPPTIWTGAVIARNLRCVQSDP
jgi:hypothetical protein